ncbi:MAG: diguanylate cyclase [Desulfobacterales bacterium]|nr:diguanylate cyclase [Desulfobacterales bacterium]
MNKDNQISEKLLRNPAITYTPKDAALLLDVSVSQLNSWSKRGIIRSTQTKSGKQNYPKEELERFVEWHGTSPSTDDVLEKFHQIRFFADFSLRLFGKIDPEDIIRMLCHSIMRSMGCTTVSVSLYDEMTRSTHLIVEHNDDGTETVNEGPVFLEDYPITEKVIDNQEVYFINASDEKADRAERNLLIKFEEKSLLMLPLVFEGRAMGIIELYDSFHERYYSEEDISFLKYLGGLLGDAIGKTQAVESFQTRNKMIRLLLSSAELIASSIPLNEALSIFTKRITEFFDVAWTELYTFDHETREFETVAEYLIPEEGDGNSGIGIRYRVDDWPYVEACQLERKPKTIYLDDPDLTDEMKRGLIEWDVQAVMVIPLIYQEQDIGLLEMAESRFYRRFGEDEQRIAMAIANHAAIAIHNRQLMAETRQRNTELSTVLEVTETVTSTMELNTVLKTLSEKLRDSLGITSTEIYLYDEDKQQFEMIADTFDNIRDGVWSGYYNIGDIPVFDNCIEIKKAITSYLDDDTMDEKSRQDMIKWGEKSTLTIPMIYKGQAVGLACLVEKQSVRKFSENDIRLASAIVAQGAAAVVNAQAFTREQAEREHLTGLNQRLNAIVELSGQMRGLISEEHMLLILGKMMSGAMGFRQWAAIIYNPENKTFRINASQGSAFAARLKRARHEIPGYVIYGLIADATLISNSYFVDHRHHKWSEPERENIPRDILGNTKDNEWHADDLLLIPLVGEDSNLIGYILAYDPMDKQTPTHETISLMEVFVAKIASTIELRKLHDLLAKQAKTDGLTGLFNHRYLHERLEEEVAKANRYDIPLMIIMIDIDNFKKFNDTYGHPQGDKLLKSLAHILIEGTRQKVDMVARYGGEEFLIMLPNTPLNEAEVVAERLRGTTERRRFEGNPGYHDVKVTLSLGIASFPLHGSSVSKLIASCDKALYEAKHAGKNRVCVFKN